MHTVSLDLGESAASGSLAVETAVSVLTAERAAPCLSRLTPSPQSSRFCPGTGAALRLLPAEAALLCWVLCCGIQNLIVIRSPVEVIRIDIFTDKFFASGCGAVAERKAVFV